MRVRHAAVLGARVPASGATWTNIYNTAPEGGVIATATMLYASNGFAGSTSPNLIKASLSADTSWTSITAPSGMPTGWKRASVTSDGTHWIIVAGFWAGGIWRYVE